MPKAVSALNYHDNWRARRPRPTGRRAGRGLGGARLEVKQPRDNHRIRDEIYGSILPCSQADKWPNTTIRPDAFRGTACCGSDPTGHAKSQAGNRCSLKHNRLRAFGPRTVCSDNAPRVRATRQDRILLPPVQCRHPEQL
jgi:hypothetical protein